MIEKLTAEQEAKLPEYRDKWIKIGLSTERCDRQEAEKWVKKVYEVVNLTPPKHVRWFQSPLACAQAQGKLKKLSDSTFKAKDADAQIDKAIAGPDVEGVYTNEQIYGAHDAGWLSFYNYFLEVVELKVCERLLPTMELAKNCGWWAPYTEIVLLQEKPTQIHMVNKQLHNETGPAIEYADGFSVHALNGTRMPKWMVMTPAEDLDSKEIAKIKNAEVRAEYIRKIGLEKALGDISNKLLDKDSITVDGREHDYELHECGFGNGVTAPALKMENPSVTGHMHVEFVDQKCTTVKEALMDRGWQDDKGKFLIPEALT